MTSEAKALMRSRARSIINTCLEEKQDTALIIQNLETAYKEIGMKDDSFNQVLNLLRDLEGNDTKVMELMFLYKLNERDELNKEAKKVTHDFHSGALDPNNKNSKYEQQMARKKTKQERINRKR